MDRPPTEAPTAPRAPAEAAPTSATPRTVFDLKADLQNTNQHHEFGQSLLEEVIQAHGFGRAVLVDRDYRMIGGSGALEAAVNAGITKVRVMHVRGDEVAVVCREDVELDSPRGRALHIADNEVSRVNYRPNYALVKEHADRHGLDTQRLGIPDDLLTNKIKAAARRAAAESSAGPDSPSGSDGKPADAKPEPAAAVGTHPVVIFAESKDHADQLRREFKAQGLDVRDAEFCAPDGVRLLGVQGLK